MSFSAKGIALHSASNLPHFDILGVPIGDYLFCANFIASKCHEAQSLLGKLEEIAGRDPQVALTLIRICDGFCRFNLLARAILIPLAFDALQMLMCTNVS